MRKDGLLALSATLLAIAALGCGRTEAAPQADNAAPPDPTVGPLVSLASAPSPTPGETWGAGRIDWQPYEAGLARAKAQNKPVCLVFYTGWCPHCRNYSKVFEDDKVVARARDLVMVRLNADDHPDLAAKYQPDGGYVPRTFFLAPDGTVASEIHAARPRFLYFFDERGPAELLGAMNAAVRKFVK